MSGVLIKDVTVSKGYQATIPSEIRGKLGIKSGDLIRWKLVDGVLSIEVIKKRKGTLRGLIGKYSGKPTDSVRDHNVMV
ncbi:MAG: AbrB/MazE/SpoVT family DNA-binding domain-containing protein [Candidatus Methanospirareceae archaeon]